MEEAVGKLIKIKTKAIDGPYVWRESEEYYAVSLETFEVPGFTKDDHLRIIPCNKDSVEIKLMPLNWIEEIDGKPVTPPKVNFTIKSDSGNTYYVNKNGSKYTCDCWGYRRWKKDCKHIKEIKNEIN